MVGGENAMTLGEGKGVVDATTVAGRYADCLLGVRIVGSIRNSDR